MRARCHQRDQSATISEPAPCCALRASVPNSNYIISSPDLFRPIYLVIYFFYYTSTQLGSTALKSLASAVPIDLATVNRRAASTTPFKVGLALGGASSINPYLERNLIRAHKRRRPYGNIRQFIRSGPTPLGRLSASYHHDWVKLYYPTQVLGATVVDNMGAITRSNSWQQQVISFANTAPRQRLHY